MKVTHIRPGTGHPIVALFDWEISADLKMLNWCIKRGTDGQLRAFAPSLRHNAGSAVAVTGPLREQVCEAAIAALKTQGGHAPRDNRTTA